MVSSNPTLPLPRSENTFNTTLPSGESIQLYEYTMPPDGDCGFHGLQIPRSKAAQQLMNHLHEKEIKEFIGSEIVEYILECGEETQFVDLIKKKPEGEELLGTLDYYHKMHRKFDDAFQKTREDIRQYANNTLHLSEEDRYHCLTKAPHEWSQTAKLLIQDPLNEIDNAIQELQECCQSFEILVNYIKHHVGHRDVYNQDEHDPGHYLTFLPRINGMDQSSSIDAIAKINQFNLRIWQRAEENNEQQDLKIAHEKIFNPNYPTVDLLYHAEAQHFNLLSRDPSLKVLPTLTAPFELQRDINQPLLKNTVLGEAATFDAIIDDLRLASNLSKDFLDELYVLVKNLYETRFQTVDQTIQTKKLKELQERYAQSQQDYADNNASMKTVFNCKSELSLYEDSLKKAKQLFFQILQKKTPEEKEKIRRSLHSGFNRELLGLGKKSNEFFESPKTVIETKKIKITLHNGEYEALQVLIYKEAYGTRNLVYHQNIKLGDEDHFLSLPDPYKMIVSKEGTLKIDQCHDNNNLVFKLDNHDIEFYNKQQVLGSIDIQSANACRIIGEMNVQGGMRVKANHFHLSGIAQDSEQPDLPGKLQTQYLEADIQSFTNRGSIICADRNQDITHQKAKITTELFDNRGGQCIAGSIHLDCKQAQNDKGLLYTDQDFNCHLGAKFDNGQGTIQSGRGNLLFKEQNASSAPKATLTNGNKGHIKAPLGHIACALNSILNEKEGVFAAKSANFNQLSKLCAGTINHGRIHTEAGCTFNHKFINNGNVHNALGQIFFNVSHLELNTDGGAGGGVFSGGTIVSSPLLTFKHTHNALYAEKYCSLTFVHSQVLNHNISMPGTINLTTLGGKLSNHAIIQSENGIQVLTPWEWGETYSFENFGGLVAVSGNIVVQGKGVLHTADGHGIYASQGSLTTNCTNINYSGRVHAAQTSEMIAKEVYTTALSAGKDILSRASQITVAGFSIAGRDTVANAQNTITVLGTLESGRNTHLTAGNSVTEAPSAQIKSGDSSFLHSNEIYLDGKTVVKRLLDIVAENAVSIKGAVFSEDDIVIKTKTFFPKGSIEAQNKIDLEVNKIAEVKLDLSAKEIKINDTAQLVNCELIIEGGKMILRPIEIAKQSCTPEEMLEQQRQIEECFEEMMREEQNKIKKQIKKKKKKMIIKSVLSTAAGVGLSAFLGPQMMLVFGKFGMSAMATSIASTMAEGMILSGMNAAIMKENILKSGLKGAALSVLGPVSKNIAQFAYDAASGKKPSLKKCAIETAFSALTTVLPGSGATHPSSSNASVSKASEVISKTAKDLALKGIKLGTKVATATRQERKKEDFVFQSITEVANTVVSALVQPLVTSSEADKTQTKPEKAQPKAENTRPKEKQINKTQEKHPPAPAKDPHPKNSDPTKNSDPIPPWTPLLLTRSNRGRATRIVNEQGRTAHKDLKTGRYSKSPGKIAKEEPSKPFTFKDTFLKNNHHEAEFVYSKELTDRYDLISNENINVTAGVRPYIAARGSTSTQITSDQYSYSANGTVAGGVNVVQAQAQGRLGEARAEVDLLAGQIDASFNLNLKKATLPTLEGSASAKGTVLKTKAEYQTPKVEVQGGTRQCKAQFEMDILSRGKSASYGIAPYKDTPGESWYGRVDLSPYIDISVGAQCHTTPNESNSSVPVLPIPLKSNAR